MPEQRALVLGANGQLGKALRAEFPNAVFYGREECDLSQPEKVSELPFDTFDVIINAAAYTAVDAAETPEGAALAEAVNASAVKALSDAAIEHGILLVHVSTDYVFDGTKKSPYLETDQFNPLGVYAQTKAQGDLAVQQVPQHYLLRTSWVIGEGNNFVRTMASLAERGIKPAVVNDQIGRLTFAEDLSGAISHLIKIGAPFGTYNFCNDGPPTSWYEIAKKVFELTTHKPEDVKEVTTEDFYFGKHSVSPRPKWSVLSNEKIRSTGLRINNWEYSLQKYLINESTHVQSIEANE